MNDPIFNAFLERQGRELTQLCENSSRLDCKLLQSHVDVPANIFMVKMRCAHLIMTDQGVRQSTEPSLIAIHLPGDYLRLNLHPGRILQLVTPRMCWHPNVSWPHICTGHISPGTAVVDLVLRSYEIFTYNKFTPKENDCLQREACRWARAHVTEFPLENQPLRDLCAEKSTLPAQVDFVLETQPGGEVS